MTFEANQSPRIQRQRTWPFRLHRTAVTGNTDGKVDSKTNYDFELNSTPRGSFKSIFMTDSSKTIEISEINLSRDSAAISMTIGSGNVITTSFRRIPSRSESLQECPICCNNVESKAIKKMPCCSTQFCSPCLSTHTITNINSGVAKIQCPGCSNELNSSAILFNTELPISARERYQDLLAQNLSQKQNGYVKLCPHCNFITILDENHPLTRRIKSRRLSLQWINCEQCAKDWCWSCYAPSHPKETCQQFQKKHTQLDVWARTRRTDNTNQRNAQKCPKCSIYIEKIDGCDHMLCSRCNSKFCYRCGSRMRLPFYFGHDVKYSVFGCKYKLWPNRPLLRWFVRGSVLTGILILTPVALGATAALVAIGIPTILLIGCFSLPFFLCLEHRKRP